MPLGWWYLQFLVLFLSRQQPGAGTDSLTDNNEATADMIRYVGHDSNVHLKSLKSDIVSVTGVRVSTPPMVYPVGRDLELGFSCLHRLCYVTLNACARPVRAVQAVGVLSDFSLLAILNNH